MRARSARKRPVKVDASRRPGGLAGSWHSHGVTAALYPPFLPMSESCEPSHPGSVCTPISPSCLDPRVPIHTTLQETVSRGSSSGMTSTVCPRLSLLKFPRSLKPFGELSTIRQGNLSVFHRMVATILARLVRRARSERRLSGTRGVGTAFAPMLISQGFPPYCLRI